MEPLLLVTPPLPLPNAPARADRRLEHTMAGVRTLELAMLAVIAHQARGVSAACVAI